MSEHTATRAAALAAIERAAELLRAPVGYAPRPAEVDTKAPHDYVTDLDVRVETAVAEVIEARLPGHGVAGEERHRPDPAAVDVWHVDPVDGTRNLVSGRPDIAVSLGWYHRGVARLGAVYLPSRRLTLLADEEVVQANGEPLSPSEVPPPDRALVALTGNVPAARAEATTRLFGGLLHRFEGVRISGALAVDLAMMALGELDARVSLGPKPVDIAAGAYLVQRLGGVVTDARGRPFDVYADSIVAGRDAATHAAALEAAREVEVAR